MQLSNKFKNNQNFGISIILVLAIIVVLNLLSDKLFWRADLTADKLYSTAAVTKSTISELADPVNIRVYFSSDLPNQFSLTRRQLDDLLSEYSVYSKNFTYQFVDPGDGKEAEMLGIPKLQFNDIRHDKLEVVTGYMGLVISYRDKQEVIPVLQDTANLEYELVSLLKKMIATQPAKLGVLQNYSTVSLDREAQILGRSLARIYDIQSVDLTEPVPTDIKALIIMGVKADLTEPELKHLDKFLMANGTLIVLHDGVTTITTPINFNVENKSNLTKLLAAYGFKVEPKLVADLYSGIAAFNQGATMYNVHYPLWPKLLKVNFNQSQPSVANLEGVIFPWVSPITLDRSKLNETAQLLELAKSSDQAWLMPSNANINPAEILRPTEQRGAMLLMASLTGKIKSAYDQGESSQARLIVIGDSDFIKDDFAQGALPNLVLMQNLIDGVALDANLAQIRSKQVTVRSIANLADSTKQLVGWLNIFGMTVLVVLAGLARYYWRKRSKTLEIKSYE